MKKRFTILITAAVMLLSMMARPVTVLGQTRENYSVTYNYSDLGDMLSGSYLDASSYWKVPETSGNTATIAIPITHQPNSDISITFNIATFGSGNNPSSSNTTITAVGTETNSNWIGSTVSSYPSSSSFVNGVMTITKPANPTTLGGLTITMGVNTGVKIFRLKSITVSYTYDGSSLQPCDLALTGAPIALEFDLYNNSDAQVINYTTSSTGAVTISASNYVTTEVNANAKTITVTPTAVTPSVQTITVSQAADATYTAGSKTFTVSITDSTPFDGVIFNATTDTGTSPIVKDHVSLACTNGVLNNGSEYRLYKNSTTTISTTDGSTITKIEFICVSGFAASNFTNQTGWTTSGDNGVWEGESESVSFVASGAQVRATQIKVTVVQNTDPSITVSDPDELAYNADNGSISYTINNYVAGTMSASTEDDWITNFTYQQGENGSVGFSTSTNPIATQRSATVTLTYTYGNRTIVTKNVTITQAGNPNVVDNISSITGEASYKVRGTVLAVSARAFVLGDNTGYIYYYNGNNAPSVAVNDKKVIDGTTTSYGHVIQFPNSAVITTSETSNYDGSPAATIITEIPDYTTGLHLSDYFQFDGTLTISNNYYYVSCGNDNICISYPSETQKTTMNALEDKTVRVKGYFAGINSNDYFTIILESIEEVVLPTVQTPTFSPAAGEYTSIQNVTIACATDGATIYYTTDGNAPTTSSTEYTSAIEVAETKTIKAIAVKEGMNDSEIATAAYTINLPVPTITVTPAEVDVIAAGVESTLTATYTNMGDVEDILADVAFYESDGTTSATYGWITANIKNDDNTVVEYLVEENEGASRTAYFKVYGTTDGEHFTYSNLVTINQAAPTYAVTFDVDGGTFVPNADFATINEEKTAGTYNLPSATKAGWDFAGWNDGTTTYEANAEYTVSAAVAFTAQWTEITTGSIVFGNNGTKINEASVTGDDSFGNTWTITTVGTSSFTQNANYSQVGSGNKPATSITFTTTLAQSTTITALEAKFGGFSSTAGTVTMKVDEATVGTGSLNGTTDVVVESNTSATGTVLTVTVTNIAKGVKCYYISYTISTGSDPMIVAQNSIALSSTDTYGEFDYSIVNPATGVNLTASSTDEWIGTINVTAEKVTFVTTPNTSTTEDREGSITLSYTGAADKVVTVTQSKVDYAEMPFVFVGNEDTPTGVSTTAGTYSSSPYLKFDATDKYLVLKLNADPVSLSYDIKGNSFLGGTFKVQTSANGTEYNDLATYTTLGDVQSVTHIDLDANVRYIKWIYTEKKSGNVALGNIHASEHYDTYGDVTFNNLDLTAASESLIIHSGSVVTVNGELTNNSPDNLIIEDGGQLIANNSVSATIQKNVTGYGRGGSGYKLIASPVTESLNVASQTNLTTGTYDLYIFDQSQVGAEWRNFEATTPDFTTIDNQKGYLYANNTTTTVEFSGALKPSNTPVPVTLAFASGTPFEGINLVGNPFPCNAYVNMAYYVLNAAGDNFESKTTSVAIPPCTGIIVAAETDGQSVTFSKEAPVSNPGQGNLNIQVAQVINSRDAQPVADNAIIRFDGGNNLKKFSFREDNTKVYIPQNGKDYAVVNAQAQGEMPVNFKAAENGTYTIDFSMDNVEFSYLHLIDNKTGMDIDLLQTSSYTFEASKIDYASRFKLVFSTNNNSNSNDDNDFAFFDANGNLLILGNEGTATLQVIDITGRTVSNETFSGNYSKAINAKAGVYMLRLIQGNDVRTQKIVVR